MDKNTIIKLKKRGFSNRSVAKLTGVDRKTIGKYWNNHQELEKQLENGENITEIQEKIVSKPKYNSSGRKNRKYTEEIDKRLNEILINEERKNNILGSHKQKLTRQQILEILKSEGFDIGYITISNKIKEKLLKSKECFIRQDYEYGDRLEYDFGEVKLLIDGELKVYHMAVLSSPAGDFRWAYLYKNQKKEVFLDSHVRFFEEIGGVYKEIVYDNMKNVVTKFIGKNEKKLNDDLIKMSIYYGFEINVTNCFKGNEKGFVESSVKIIRNKVFATIYEFKTLEYAQIYLNSQLLKMNENSKIETEKAYLLPYRPKLELATISENDVNKYSFIRVDNNFYSVPDYLVDKRVTVKKYFDKILVYSNNHFVCEHKKIDGSNKISIEIKHYLNTFIKKPGALKNSLALKKSPELKYIFENHFTNNPKKFIEILINNKQKDYCEIVSVFNKYITVGTIIDTVEINNGEKYMYETTKMQLLKYSQLQNKDVFEYAN